MDFERSFSGAPWEKAVGYCRALRAGDHIHVTGTAPVADDGGVFAPGDPYRQAGRCLEIIERALTDLGADRTAIVRTRMFVTDIAAWAEFGRAHREFFGGHVPTTTMVEVKALIDPAMLIEIEATAFSPAPEIETGNRGPGPAYHGVMRSALLLLLLLALSGRTEAGGGLRLQLTLDRKAYAPGEYVTARLSAVNGGGGTVKARRPGSGSGMRNIDVRLVSPSGKEYRHARIHNDGLPVSVGPGKSVVLHAFSLRLSQGRSGFSPGPPPLLTTGTWRIRVAHPEPGGLLESNAASFRVRTVPAAQRRKGPTLAERKAVARFRKMSPAYDGKDADLLREAFLLTKSEGLARHVLDLLVKGPGQNGDDELVTMLTWRAASRTHGRWKGELHAGIDGTYLARFAGEVLTAWERARKPGLPDPFRTQDALNAVSARVRLHPGDLKTRERLEALARRAAKVRMKDPAADFNARRWWESDGPFSPEYAWALLIDLGVLHPGMKLTEAAKILGEYRDRGGPKGKPRRVAWYLASPRHVNPCLGAEVEDGKILRFHLSNA